MAGPTYSFGRFQVELGTRRLLADGQAVPVTVKAFDILAALIEEAGRVVDKDELMRQVWPDTIVEEANLSQQIFLLRKALGEGPKDHRYIATVPRRGYRFVAEVIRQLDDDRPAASASAGPAARAAAPMWDATRRPLKLSLSLVPGPPLVLAPSRPFAISPDGRTIAYVARDGATSMLAVRRLDARDVLRLPRTEGATSPFFSPDSRWIGYFANGRLQRVPAAGGTPIDVCDAGTECRGAAWSCRDEIVFAPTPASGLVRVRAEGGRPEPATTLDFSSGERTHRWPEMLPDGRSVLFTVARAGSASFEEADIVLASLETGERQLVRRFGCSARYLPTGHLVYMRGGSLMAVPFDLVSRTATGSSMPVLDDVMTQPTGAGYFSASEDGSLLYLTGDRQDVMQRLVWVAGAVVTFSGIEARALDEPRISPDGRRIAFGIREATSDIWTHDLERGASTRLTFEGDNFAPIWRPDGRGVTFSTNRSGPCQIVSQSLDADQPTLLVGGNLDLVPGSWSPDGKLLLFTEYNPHTGAGVWICAPDRNEAPTQIVRSRGNAFAPRCAPDGRSFAYASDETGRLEVYVASFPGGGDKRQVTFDGGSEPVWSRDGERLYYRNGSSVFATALCQTKSALSPRPVAVADGPYPTGAVTGLPNFDAAADDRLLLVTQRAAVAHPDALSVTVHWFSEILSRLA